MKHWHTCTQVLAPSAKVVLLCLMLIGQWIELYASNDPCAPTQLISSTNLSFHNNTGFGSSAIPDPPFGNYGGSDFWFNMSYTQGHVLLIEGQPGFNPAVAVYEPPCDDPKLLYNVVDNNCDGSSGVAIIFDELNPGQDYLIRVWNEGGGQGEFSVYYNDGADNPEFVLFGDAFMDGDCIQLTETINDQQSCAYFEVPLDFTQPFTRSMTANFGTIDADGADGICLVFQSNSISTCGVSGEGIGAQGILNSFIIEFDTWQNGNLNDPVLDHASINVNGNMNHANSIEGPVIIGTGNIEDGMDHSIDFTWDPATDSYEVVFDGVVILSGVFDIINQCFNGQTTAWWGYTSATGGSFNNQSVCPAIEEFHAGQQTYQEAVICEGETFMGYSDPGFYIDFEPGPDGCDRQINTYIEVMAPDTSMFVDTICQGQSYTLGGQTFVATGVYEVTIPRQEECDSLVILDLTVIDYQLLINTQDITCSEPGILSSQVTSGLDVDVSYSWRSPSNIVTSDNVVISSEPGVYFLTVNIRFGTILT